MIYEVVAVIMTLFCVFQLNGKNSIGWVYGIIGAAMFFIVFIKEGLLFQSGLQVIFLIQSAYGWWLWSGSKKSSDVEPKMMKNGDFISHILGVTALSIVIVPYIERLGGVNSFLDVLTTLLALLATYYLSKKIIQAWYLWVIINALMIVLFYTQGLWMATSMEIILLIISFNASVTWTTDYRFKELRKSIRNEKV